MPGVQQAVIKFMLHPVKMGAYTELFAGWSPEFTPKDNGRYLIPWGRFGTYHAGLVKAAKSKAEGGSGVREQLWDVCEKVIAPYK